MKTSNQITITNLTDIDRLEISGRNLLLQSGIPSGITGTGVSNTVGCHYTLAETSSSIFGKHTVFACEWAYEGNTPGGIFYWCTGETQNASVTPPCAISASNVSGRIQQSWTPASSGSFTELFVRADGVKGKLIIRNPRLYLGMKDMGWAPAPEDLDSQLHEVNKTITTLETEVDNNRQAIRSKVTQNDITTSINHYDGATVKTIRDRVSATEHDITGLHTSVSDTQTSLEKKADGSTLETLSENLSKLEQNANVFRQTVSETYSTKDEVTSIHSALTQKADEIEQSVSNLDGDISTLTTSLQGITQRVADAEGDVSKVAQTVSQISSTVSSKKDIDINNIRYIRDWLNGSTANDGNRWANCQVWGRGENYAEGLTPSGYTDFSSPIPIAVTNPGYYTSVSTLNGNNHKNNYAVISDGDWRCLQIDLKEIKKVDYISVWHYFADARKCNHKLQVSRDGIHWFMLYDSELQGTYAESVEGKVYVLNDVYIVDTFSNITQDYKGIQTLVRNNQTAIGTWDATVKDIQEKADVTNGDIDKITDFNREASEKLEDLAQKSSAAEQTIEEIKTSVQNFGDTYALKSEVLQTDSSWKVALAQVGLYNGADIEQQETNFTVSSKGAILDNGKGQEILMVANDKENGLFGKYNGNVIFQVTQDLTIAERFQARNGVDCLTMKLVPKTYMKNGKSFSGLMHVKSGGTS